MARPVAVRALDATSGTYVDLDGSHPDVVVGSWVVLVDADLPRAVEGEERHRAVARRLRDLGQGHAARARGRRELRPLRRQGSRDDRLRGAGGARVRRRAGRAPSSRATRSTWTSTCRRCAPAGGCSCAARRPAAQTQTENAVVKSVQSLGGRWRIELEEHLSTAYERASVIVHGNVALGTHGETVQQLLGSGRAALPFQRFTLAHDAADVSPVDRRPVGCRRRAGGSRRRRSLGRGADALRRRAARPRVRAAHRRGRARLRAVRRRRARRAAAVRLEQRARDVPQGHRRRRQRARRARSRSCSTVRSASRASAIPRPRAAVSIRSRRSRRAHRSRSACARSGAPSRCSTTRISRARSAASRRRTPRCCSCAPARRSSSPSRSRAATGSTTSPTR